MIIRKIKIMECIVSGWEWGRALGCICQYARAELNSMGFCSYDFIFYFFIKSIFASIVSDSKCEYMVG